MDLGHLVKRIGVATDRIVKPPAGITVLIYHRVGGGSDSAVDLPVDDFDAQMAHLAEHHRVITLDQAVRELTGPATGWGSGAAPAADDVAGTPGVVITFDDGTTDFADHVVPTLERHGVPATLYVATEFVDTGTEFPWDAPPATWSALRDTLTTGLVTIGSHTHSHWLLDRLAPEHIAADLDTSIDLIGSNLGVTAEHFAYPKALPGSPAAEIEIRKRFRSAALAASRVNRPGRTDLHRLWRTPIQTGDGFEFFTAKAAGGLRLEGELRSLAARARYRGART